MYRLEGLRFEAPVELVDWVTAEARKLGKSRTSFLIDMVEFYREKGPHNVERRRVPGKEWL